MAQEIKSFPVYLHKSHTVEEMPISRPQKTLLEYNSACRSATNPLLFTAVIKQDAGYRKKITCNLTEGNPGRYLFYFSISFSTEFLSVRLMLRNTLLP